MIEEAVKAAKESDVSVLVLGISAGLEGEEMNVCEGFRAEIEQTSHSRSLRRLCLKPSLATGKPVVVVLLSGSALAVNWANDQCARDLAGVVSG